MTVRHTLHRPSLDPEPPVGTVLTGGSPGGGDRVTLHRLETGWTVSYGGGKPQPCTYATVRFWGALRVVAGPPVTPGRPSVPEFEWLDDVEKAS